MAVTRVSWLVDLPRGELAQAAAALRADLARCGLADAGDITSAEELRGADLVVVLADQPLRADLAAAVTEPATRCVLAGPTLPDADPDGALAAAAGLRLDGVTPPHDIRLRLTAAVGGALDPATHSHGDHAHRDQHEHLTDRVVRGTAVAPDVRVLAEARVGLTAHPVMTWRPATGCAAWLVGATAQALGSRTALRRLVQLVRLIAGEQPPSPVRVGLLGYGAIGDEHSRAVRATPGLALSAVCDTSAQRRALAAASAEGVATTDSAEALLAREDVDLVVVSTPPDTHAAWARDAIAAGKHVVVEKPFAIDTRQADEVLAAAAAADRLAVVYQNRRYDPDHRALAALVTSGALGRVFHIEAFVGGHGHPCNLWHSDEGVSGGAFYDWGAHVLDQVLDLVDAPVEHVTAATHKLAWFDVTNADHSRVSLRFVDGTEAHFIHSDLAAALKPRWYVLGTRAAVVGHWRRERVVSRSDIGTLVEDALAPADSPPRLALHAADGSVTRLATPAGEPYQFHGELADHLRWGLPMPVTGQQSRRVLAVMEAARASAADGGQPVVPR